MDSQQSSAAASSSKRKAGGSTRSDPAWDHARPVLGDTRRMECKFCGKQVTGGAFRFKNHLVGNHNGVEPCKKVPDNVRDKFIRLCVEKAEAKSKDKDVYSGEAADDISSQRPRGSLDAFVRRNSPSVHSTGRSQSTINEWLKKDAREEAMMETAWFFYENAIPFNVTRTPSFARMVDAISRHGPGCKPATYNEVRVSCLKKAKTVADGFVEQHREDWKKYGCTVMSDGWTDMKRRSILNFMVNSPMGTVFVESMDASSVVKDAATIFTMLDNFVEKVGEENVVQVVTDNATNYVKAGELLMAKRTRLYWMPCQAHCVDLILEDFEKNLPLHKQTISKGRRVTTYIYGRAMLISMLKTFTNGRDLIRPAVTRFATAYLTLGCLYDLRASLMSMFASETWKTSRFASQQLGKDTEATILDNEFWLDVRECLRATDPIIKVLRMVDSDVQPAMPYMYEAVQNAQEKIRKNFNNVRRSYEPILKIIDARWLNKMSKPLHLVGYYLNPRIVYREDYTETAELKKAWFDVVERMAGQNMLGKLDLQLTEFKCKGGFFGSIAAVENLNKMPPYQWWNTYGISVPELTKFVVRILSLTCSSSGCERNWSAFDRIHTKKRNHLSQQKVNDLVYVMCNKKLMYKKPRTLENDDEESIPSDNEWLANDEDVAEDECAAEDDVQIVDEDATQSGGHMEDRHLGDDVPAVGRTAAQISPNVEMYGSVDDFSEIPSFSNAETINTEQFMEYHRLNPLDTPHTDDFA